MKKVYRLYREVGLQLRNKTPKGQVKAKLREDRAPAIRPNDVWAMDFVHDQLATGGKLRIAPVPATGETLALMRVIDAAFLDMPWYGSGQMVRHLRPPAPQWP